jgi:hypothetical protein
MNGQWRHLPGPARPIAAAASDAVDAAKARDTEAFTEATNALGALDTAQVGLVLGTALRLIMEDLHPDGLDGDDVREVLTGSVRSAATWWADVDPHVLLILLAGALGVHDPDEQETPPKPDTVARHAALLLDHLLGARPLKHYLDRAAYEIERTQLND